MSGVPSFQVALASDLGGQALDGVGDSHLAPGIHLRVAPSPDLGLPAQPLSIVRLSLGPGSGWPGVRHDVEWIDSQGNPRFAPFTVEPDNPVYGFLPRANGATCCWLRVEQPRGGLVRPPVVGSVAAPPRMGAGTRRVSGALTPAPGSGGRVVAPSPLLAAPGTIAVRAFMSTEMGAAVVATRTQAPLEVAATPIDWIEVQGSARVNGVSWLDVRDVLSEIVRRNHLPETDPSHLEQWRAMALPVEDAVRYTGAPPDAVAQSNARVKEGAPTRLGLHDAPKVAGPGVSPPATPGDEATRLLDFTTRLGDYLQKLVSTLAPGDLVEKVPMQPGSEFDFTTSVLSAVLQTLADPGAARWMAHAVVDPTPPTTTAGNLVAYGVAGGWMLSETEGQRPRRIATVLCAVVGHPGTRPAPPGIDEPVGGPFLPVPPPEALRVVQLRLRGLVPGAGVAAARQVGTAVTGLNKRAPSGRAIPFWPHVPEDATTFGESKITDRGAPAEAFVYRISQQDWFGRWSEWALRDVAAAERPGPPKPILYAAYTPPAVTDPIQVGAIRGSLSIMVPVPPVAALSPGSRLLDHLELSVDGAMQNVALPSPSAPAPKLTADLTGPAIERAGTRTVTLIARWVDQAGVRSAPSDPRTLALNDPRPAPAVTFPPGLRYTSRPDATGKARFRLQWVSGPAQAFFRVFYSDETRLLRGLAQLAEGGGTAGSRATAALQSLGVTGDPAERAARFEAVEDLFSRDLFEQITPKPLEAGAPGSAVGLDHAVSGALRVLSFYRVVSVTAAQVESLFNDASIVSVRVPNTLPSPRPTLMVQPRFDTGTNRFVAELTVSVPLGNVAPTEFRIRRGLQTTPDLNGMFVVATGNLQATPEGRRRAVYSDAGAQPLGRRLEPWLRYLWRAEVRGPAEVGGGPSADWSPPSQPVAHVFVPPTPPPPATIVSLTQTVGGNVAALTRPRPAARRPCPRVRSSRCIASCPASGPSCCRRSAGAPHPPTVAAMPRVSSTRSMPSNLRRRQAPRTSY